ncbi:MAG: site-specific integrase [Chloroflexi bacterium]|nr:site-specific integrase [Chloroflexota bacterium]
MPRRRGHGEGTICQRADGRWCAAVSLPNGKRKYVYSETRRAVQEKLSTVKRQLAQGLLVGTDRQIVGQFLAEWLHAVRASVRPKTYDAYALFVRRHIAPALGHIRLTALAPQQVQTFLNDRMAAGLSPRTVKHLHAVLRRALNQAVRWGLVARNVATVVDVPRPERHEIRPLTPEEAQRLLKAVRGDRLEALYTLALYVGLRQGELLGLRWQDVDLERAELRVVQALQRAGGQLRLVEPKSAQSRRALALPGPVVAALKEHRKRQLAEHLKVADVWHDSGLVFTTSIGTPIEPRGLIRRFHALLERAGLPPMRFHDLRHGCATLLLAGGVHPKLVQELLGHSRISITMDIYSHVTPAMQRKVAQRMEALLRARS